jgi:hypothetical protein
MSKDYAIRRPVEEVPITLDSLTFELAWIRVTLWEYDAHYGADADGNRGQAVWGFMDDTPEEITLRHPESQTVTIYEDLTAKEQAEVLAVIEAWQHAHPPDQEPDEGPEEPDCDDIGD